MTKTITVTITIGLATAEGPLSPLGARAFIASVEHSLTLVGAEVHFRGEGTGTSAQWGEEPAYTWVCAVPWDHLGNLRLHLAVDARTHEQDAIALTVGAVEFITP